MHLYWLAQDSVGIESCGNFFSQLCSGDAIDGQRYTIKVEGALDMADFWNELT